MTRREFMLTMTILAATAVVLRHVPKAVRVRAASGGGWQVGWQFPWRFGEGEEAAEIYLPIIEVKHAN